MEKINLLDIFISLFIIIDPVGAVPIFLGITAGVSKKLKKIIALRATILSIIVVIIFSFMGAQLLHLFGIDLKAFKIAGGIVLSIIAYDMLNANITHIKTTESERSEVRDKLIEEQGVWIVPLAIPTLVGPVTMASIIIYSSQVANALEKITIISIATICLIIAYFFMIYSDKIINKLGNVGINAISRLLGIILLSIAIKMIVYGIKEIWHS